MTAGVGGSTKKVVFTVAFQFGYIAGNIVGPQTYRPSDAPNYYVSGFSKPTHICDQSADPYIDCEVHHAGILDLLHFADLVLRRHTLVLEPQERSTG